MPATISKLFVHTLVNRIQYRGPCILIIIRNLRTKDKHAQFTEFNYEPNVHDNVQANELVRILNINEVCLALAPKTVLGLISYIVGVF